MKFCIDVETLTWSLYSGYRDLLDMPLLVLRQYRSSQFIQATDPKARL
ncbi:hypothetical protein Golax_022771 [Gossypium laxum]|uniref:Uncharacterized protein n=1 Tax=Gossypium laxum TaxID=34288 RepID=A0A7J9AZS1_9ROSI|nr:hypothetical protein [Gossypium laxum]